MSTNLSDFAFLVYTEAIESKELPLTGRNLWGSKLSSLLKPTGLLNELKKRRDTIAFNNEKSKGEEKDLTYFRRGEKRKGKEGKPHSSFFGGNPFDGSKILGTQNWM